MTRRFAPHPIPAATLDAVLAAALRAPSAGFAQGVDLLVLAEPERRATFWAAASDATWRMSERASGLLAAPTLVLPIADLQRYEDRYGADDKSGTLLGGRPVEHWPTPLWLVDASFSAMLVLLAATRHGIGALFFQLHAPAERIRGAQAATTLFRRRAQGGLVMAQTAPYGTWASPVQPSSLVEQAVGLSNPVVFDGELYWNERRANEAARHVVVVRRRDGMIADVLPAPYSARTLVHEYGGASFLPTPFGLVVANH